MKKFARLIAVTLVCVLLLSLVSVAHADTCYETIKLMYQLDDDENLVNLGEGVIFDSSETDTSSVFFIVSVPDSYVGVTGLNAQSQPEGYTWLNIEEMDALLAFVQFCVGFETLSENLDECDQLAGGIFLVPDEEPFMVTNVEEAQNFLTLFNGALEQE